MPFVFNPVSEESKTASDIVEEILRLFLSGQREELNKLSSTAGASATELSFQYDLGSIRNGSQVEIDLESYYVWDVDQTSKVATVQPAINGSKTAVHSTGSLVHVNPKLLRASIFDAINAEIRSLSSPIKGLYSVVGLDFTYSSPTIMYDLADTKDVIDVLQVTTEQPGATNNWAHMDVWRLDSVTDLTTFPSGNALYLPNGLPGRKVRVIYGIPFIVVQTLSDDLYLDNNGDPKLGGVPPSMHDILVYGALLRLGPIREVKRNFTEAQGDSRRATEVPPAAVMNSYTELRRLYQRRIDEESSRLSQLFDREVT